ncbi:MiaB/RimO family radical SAM methylthiotransferase [Candidatus Roizmanbacteria bacterium]|nr:MiaB/RimO family radical SAM methylthiotransferase [Candidatus Roizmanbacteria bacterium]
MKYFIHTFGCQQNVADSERIATSYENRGIKPAKDFEETNYAIINTCMIRHAPENRVRGLVQNLAKIKQKKIAKKQVYKIIVTGCMTGMATRDATGKYLKKLRDEMPEVDEFMPIEEVGFDHPPVRTDKLHAWLPISNGCNNFCSFCVVPFTRGREVSRPYEDIINECKELIAKGYKSVILLGQNVNSYGSDLVQNSKIKPVMVKHLGKYRIPTLFPHLLGEVAKLGFEHIDFMSSNPWDFSKELIEVIAKNKNITRTIHLPIQSGDSNVLKRMNRWYTREEYLKLVSNLKFEIRNLKLTTDIIVGFCGETDEEFENTVKLCKEVDFDKAYVSIYSKRPFTQATKSMKDDVPYAVKKARWQILEDLIFRSKAGK